MWEERERGGGGGARTFHISHPPLFTPPPLLRTFFRDLDLSPFSFPITTSVSSLFQSLQIFPPMMNMVNSLSTFEEVQARFLEQNRIAIQPALIERNEWCTGRNVWQMGNDCWEQDAMASDGERQNHYYRVGPPRDCIEDITRCQTNNCIFTGDHNADQVSEK